MANLNLLRNLLREILTPNLRSCGFLLNWLDFTREYSPNNSKCVTHCNAVFFFFLVKKSWDELKYFWVVHQHKCCQLRWICNKQYSFKLCLQIICSSPNSYIFPWFLICKNITFLSKWMLFCQIKLEVDQILCWSNVWSCETMVKLSEEEMGGCPFSLLHRTVVSRKREMEGRSEWMAYTAASSSNSASRSIPQSPRALQCGVAMTTRFLFPNWSEW